MSSLSDVDSSGLTCSLHFTPLKSDIMERMNDVIDFILNKMPAGVIVFDQTMGIIFSNRQAKLFLKRHKLPDEITTICKGILDAISASKLRELFPGEVCLFKKLEGSPNIWTFRFHIREQPEPLVGVFITEESVSNKIDLTKIRDHFRLTRRETDVLWRVLNGLKNIEIADDLEISEQTVKDYLSNIYTKLGVENRFALASLLLNSPEFKHR
jgi:DNA-binding CsgD family transcriptional regulator